MDFFDIINFLGHSINTLFWQKLIVPNIEDWLYLIEWEVAAYLHLLFTV